MELPDYYARSLLRRIERIAGNATCTPNDLRTANALRLLNADVRKLKKKLPPQQDG